MSLAQQVGGTLVLGTLDRRVVDGRGIEELMRTFEVSTVIDRSFDEVFDAEVIFHDILSCVLLVRGLCGHTTHIPGYEYDCADECNGGGD